MTKGDPPRYVQRASSSRGLGAQPPSYDASEMHRAGPTRPGGIGESSPHRWPSPTTIQSQFQFLFQFLFLFQLESSWLNETDDAVVDVAIDESAVEGQAQIDDEGRIDVTLNVKKTLPPLPLEDTTSVWSEETSQGVWDCPPLNIVIFIVGSRGA